MIIGTRKREAYLLSVLMFGKHNLHFILKSSGDVVCVSVTATSMVIHCLYLQSD
jgi:hypothetical protein